MVLGDVAGISEASGCSSGETIAATPRISMQVARTSRIVAQCSHSGICDSGLSEANRLTSSR